MTLVLYSPAFLLKRAKNCHSLPVLYRKDSAPRGGQLREPKMENVCRYETRRKSRCQFWYSQRQRQCGKSTGCTIRSLMRVTVNSDVESRPVTQIAPSRSVRKTGMC